MPVAAEHGVRDPDAPRTFVEHQDALRLRAAVVGPGMLAVHVGRVAQEEERHHGEEGVPNSVDPALEIFCFGLVSIFVDTHPRQMSRSAESERASAACDECGHEEVKHVYC